jgi:hypothetical protein
MYSIILLDYILKFLYGSNLNSFGRISKYQYQSHLLKSSSSTLKCQLLLKAFLGPLMQKDSLLAHVPSRHWPLLSSSQERLPTVDNGHLGNVSVFPWGWGFSLSWLCIFCGVCMGRGLAARSVWCWLRMA